jgi:hypothetical protein
VVSGGPTQLLLAACGALVASGLCLAVAGLAPAPRTAAPARPDRARAVIVRVRGWVFQSHRRLAAALGVGVAVFVVTGWPVAALLTVPAALTLPKMLGPDRRHAAEVARVEAVAGWTEMLRDTLNAAAGLEQAILATETITPDAIASEVRDLAAQIRAGARLRPALDRFATQLADPTADLVVAALLLTATGQARDVAALLGALAASAREHAAMRLRVAAGRARTRTTVRVIIGTTLTLAAVLILASRPYLTAYDTTAGQLVLLTVAGLFTAGLAWLDRLSRLPQYTRHHTAAPGPWVAP